MSDDDIRKAAYARWEAEGRPQGQDERHWREALDELSAADRPPPASSPDQGSGSISAPEESGSTSSEAIRSRESRRGGFKPGELASENK
ncbi:DUF2934 domain-containing protein [Rhizobium lusitanum]|uniref:DUF2934 domain-containing protein n=1 Tax=Rhizobium lusitanum TaxID=293958 RepID=A0A6L9UC76_9HYPH|nr:DUF2934 domain-containing protein [Rhizobium lusitanum]NEI73204.1 DUF2934 domain-containing protein [Rhizobium lusitanum]